MGQDQDQGKSRARESTATQTTHLARVDPLSRENVVVGSHLVAGLAAGGDKVVCGGFGDLAREDLTVGVVQEVRDTLKFLELVVPVRT